MTDDITDLRRRVEALELWRATTGDTAPITRDRAKDAAVPSNSLMERLADAIYINATGGVGERACAAIHAIANWLDQQELHVAATRLRQEVE